MRLGPAALFPGVGAQSPAMGQWLHDRSANGRRLFAEASDVLQRDITALCVEPDREAELGELRNSQVAVFTVSCAGYAVAVEELGFAPKIALGHSLGEWAALCCAGALSFADAVALVDQRARILTEVAARTDGTMAWVVGLPTTRVENVCAQLRRDGADVYVGAYDAVDQATVSGTRPAVQQCAAELEELGALLYPLQIDGPFHTPLVADAASQLRALVAECDWRTPSYPVLANCTGKPHDGPSGLAAAVEMPVLFQQGVDAIRSRGAAWALEVGPKNVLSYLIKRSAPAWTVRSLDGAAACEAIHGAVLRADDRAAVVERCLGAIVATRARPMAAAVYDSEVEAPARRLATMLAERHEAGVALSQADVETAFEVLSQALDAKGADLATRERRFAHALAGRLIMVRS